ncbi:MAG: hypothetical protein JSR18_02355 [Proteobacteria bacterium]|nr:hypothetical protein [Pseudomonadota bacterium]
MLKAGIAAIGLATLLTGAPAQAITGTITVAKSAEIALLDAREPPFDGWERSGYSFNAYAPGTFAGNPAMAVCRFYNDTFAPKSSHFYAAHGLGCETTLAKFPDWKLETEDAFDIASPVCYGAQTVARYYNNGQGGAPNHRFVTSAAQARDMMQRGWVAEGIAPEQPGVAFCAPLP